MRCDAPVWQQGGGDRAAAAVVAAAARRQHSAWQCGGSVRLGSAAAHCCVIGKCHAATARCHGGDEDTGSDSNGGGTNNQQSTKNMETVAMTVKTITMEIKGTAVAAEVR